MPRRVTFVAPFGLGRKGTTRARVLPLAAALAARGEAVRVLVPSWDVPAEAGRRYRQGAAVVQHLPLRRRLGRAALGQIALELVRHALAGDPHVVHCFKPIGYAGAAALWLWAARARGRWRGLLAVDTDDLEGKAGWATLGGYPTWQRQVREWQERLVLGRADLVTAASRCLQRVARARGRRAVYLPNAGTPPAPGTLVDSPAAGAPTLLLYTRFNEFKPARGAVLAAAVLDRAPAARLLVVGDTASAAGQSFRRWLAAFGYAHRATYANLPEGTARDALLASATVALWPFDDSLVNRARSPAKLLDLLWLGRAVVAEGVGEVPALVGAAARVVPAGQPASFANAVAELLARPAERRALEQDARLHAARTATWSERARRLADAYWP